MERESRLKRRNLGTSLFPENAGVKENRKILLGKTSGGDSKIREIKNKNATRGGLRGLCACRARSVLQRLVFQTNFDFAAQNRAVFDDDATRLHTASNSAGAPDLDALAGLERADHFAPNDNFAGFDFAVDPGVGPTRETATANANFSFTR